MILACDGIFDFLSNEDVSLIVRESVQKWKPLGTDKIGECVDDIVRNILKYAMREGSDDNLTAIIVLFRNILE